MNANEAIYITQLVYIRQGEEKVFQEFESHAIPIISQYEGKLLLRLRPTEDTVISSEDEMPYEVHLVVFPSKRHFEAFKLDEARKQFLHLKAQSIRAALTIEGIKLG